MFKSLQAFLSQKNNINSDNPISIGRNGVELLVIKEIQIYRHMTIYGQN